MAHFGELLAELRQDHGLTQDQLAEIYISVTWYNIQLRTRPTSS